MIAMKLYGALFLILFLAVFLFCETAEGMYQLEYRIEVHADGSAIWIVEHRFLLETEYDEMMFQRYYNMTYFSDNFVKNVNALVNSARLKTGRADMSVANFKMTVSVFDSYRIVKYQFDWVKFAEIEGTLIRIGDVFEVKGLFFYGEGPLNVIYPSEYLVENVSPKPNVESDGTLTWYEVKNFGTGEPTIVLEKRTSNIIDVLKANAPIIISLSALAGIGSVSLWFFKFRKKEKEKVIGAPEYTPPIPLGIQDDEEKVVSLVRAAGGNLYQSTIADQCGFSRSKTSKLLKTMENKGKIRREKKGREKVVTLLNETGEFEKTRNKRRIYD